MLKYLIYMKFALHLKCVCNTGCVCQRVCRAHTVRTVSSAAPARREHHVITSRETAAVLRGTRATAASTVSVGPQSHLITWPITALKGYAIPDIMQYQCNNIVATIYQHEMAIVTLLQYCDAFQYNEQNNACLNSLSARHVRHQL